MGQVQKFIKKELVKCLIFLSYHFKRIKAK